MRFFRRRIVTPPVVHEVSVDPEAANRELSKAATLHQSAQVQADVADAVVTKLVQSRIRNGFAPAIEDSIMKRHLGGMA